MAQIQTEPKLLLPVLQPFYDTVIPLSWLVVRFAVGWNLLVHGYPKFLNGSSEAALKAYANLGFTPPAFWFWASASIETFAGISLILGLLNAILCRGCRHRNADHHHNLLGQRLRLDAPRLRICAAVGAVVLCHRAAWRRALFSRPQARPRTVKTDRQAKGGGEGGIAFRLRTFWRNLAEGVILQTNSLQCETTAADRSCCSNC